MRRTLVLLSLLVVACDRPVVSPPATDLTQVGGSASVKGEFELSTAPTAIEIERGATASVAIGITRSKNFKKDVLLTVAGAPEGLSASASPAVTDGDAALLNLAAATNAPLGTSILTITAKANGREPLTASVEVTIVRPLIPIRLDFCASDRPLWFAFQNDGEPWTEVVPDANAGVFFKATEKVAIALTRGRRSSSGVPLDGAFSTSVLYVTADELLPLSGVPCVSEFGSKVLNGNVAGLASADNAVVSMHLIPFNVGSFSPVFRALRKPDVGALDLIASRRVAGDAASFIIRRGLDLPNEAIVPLIDFNSAEAVPAETHPYTVTGLRGTFNDQLLVDFWTGTTPGAMPSYQRLAARFAPNVPGSGTFRTAPASLLMAGDRHEVTVRTGFNAEFAGVTSVFRTGAPQTLAIGPALSLPTNEAMTQSRFRSMLASQPEYGAAARLVAFSVNVFTVDVTASYHGGTPATWELAIPDFSAVSGWNSAWGHSVGQSVILDVSGWSVAAVDIPALWIETGIAPWARPFADGTVVNFAGRRQSLIALP